MKEILLGALVLMSAGLKAQTKVNVTDARDGSPISFAQVQLLAPDGAVLASFEADDKGSLDIADRFAQRAIGGTVNAVALGYRHGRVPFNIKGTQVALVHNDKELGQVVVTGQYGPMRADQAVHKVRVIDAELLRRLAANDLSDALRNELNIRLSQDNVLGTSVSMQGLGGQNVKILVDGVPVIGRQDGDLDLAQIDLNGIDRIEVVEGPLSVSYGTNALAGTINLITKKTAQQAPQVKLMAYAEQIGRLNLWANAAKRWGRHNLNLNIGRDYFNGWNPGQTGIPDFTPQVADTSRFQQWKPREQYNARFNYRWNGPRWQLGYKGEFSDDLITNRGRPIAPYYITAVDETYKTTRVDNALFADRYWGNGRKLSILAAHDRYRRVRNTWRRDLTDLSEQLMGTEGMQDTSSFTLTNVRAVYASASDTARLRYEFGTDLNYETGAGQRIGDGQGEDIGDYALFTSVEYRPVKQLVLRPAVRYAHNTVYGAPLVPSFNLRWQVDTALAVRLSYARGFRAPSLKELYLLFVDVNHNIRGNTDLSAERSNNFGLSFTWNRTISVGTLRAELNGFYNDVEDLITLAQVDGTLYSYINIGHYRTLGGTAGLTWEWKRWRTMIGTTATGRNDDLSEEQDAYWLWSPEFRWNVGYTWEKIGLTAQTFLKWQGPLQRYAYRSDGTVGRATMDAFTVADASVTKRFAKRFGLTLGCKNLFDVRNVQNSMAVGDGAHSASSNSVPMMTGRIWFTRIDIDITKER